MCRVAGRLLTGLVALATGLTLAMSWLQTRVSFFREPDIGPAWHVRVVVATVVLAPLSILLFAGGVQWLMRGRVLRGLLAVPALPAWLVGLWGFENVVANDFWFSLVGVMTQGIHPFGEIPQ